MKRLLPTLLLCVIMLLAACSPTRVEADPDSRITPAPTAPTPAPTPRRLQVVFVTDTLEGESYFNALFEAAQQYNITLTHAAYAQGMTFNLYDGILLLRTLEDTDIGALDAPASGGAKGAVVDLTGGSPKVGLAYATYGLERAAAATLEEVLSYPPHDTPVRLFALLETEGSPADVAYQATVAQGKVFDRGTFYQTEEDTDARAFLYEHLDRYVEGLTDAIYVENEALLALALDVLHERSRTDMEVFCVPTDTLEVQLSHQKKYVFPLAMGADVEAELLLQLEALAEVMKGNVPQTRSFEPVVADINAPAGERRALLR